MATNKRKDSAALFELIGKSTLKVPKNAASLKIPSWWSSKTNPPAPAARATTTAQPAQAADSDPELPDIVSQSTRPVLKPFSVDSAPTPSRSIRPPARTNGTAVATIVAPTPVPRPAPGVFAPSTYDPSSSHSRGSQTRGAPPLWLLLAGALAVVFLVIAVLIYVFGGKSSTTTTRVTPSGDPAPRVIPAPDHDPTPPRNDQPQPQPPQQNNNQNPAQARVVPFDEVRRIPNANYLFIFTADEKTATANAQYLADHGISTSVSATNYPKYFVVISVDGFTRLDDPAAIALQKRVVELGREHPDARKARAGVYDTAYYKKIVRTP